MSLKKNIIWLFLCLFFINALSASNEDKANKTIAEREIHAQTQAENYTNLINLYNPSYILPFYNTNHPYNSIYYRETPNFQPIKRNEFKAYFSFLIPVVRHLIKEKPLALNFAYSQLMYWQVYTKSPFFRETNYEPELFIENYFPHGITAQLGVNHQSNGRGGYLERSWNRVYGQLKFSGNNWIFKTRGWSLLAENDSSNLHNPEIAYYLGYDNFVFSYNFHRLIMSVEAQNIESGFKRGFVNLSLSYPILKSISVFGQFFNGYGQSLIEYNHKTTSFGVGITLNNWINL